MIAFPEFAKTFPQNFPLKLEKFTPRSLPVSNALKREIAQSDTPVATAFLGKSPGHVSNDSGGPFFEAGSRDEFVELFPKDDTGFLNNVIRIRPVPDDGQTDRVQIVVRTFELTKKVRFSSRLHVR